jgi:predicted nucleic acid-binding Zn ribbon protein
MDRAGKLIRNLKLPAGCLNPEELVRAAWPLAVGPRISAHTRAVALQDGRLIVEVEDVIWQRQLQTLASQILARLVEIAGAENVAAIEFRRGIPRREPQRAESLRQAGRADEADAIPNPILRRLYKESRRRAAG